VGGAQRRLGRAPRVVRMQSSAGPVTADAMVGWASGPPACTRAHRLTGNVRNALADVHGAQSGAAAAAKAAAPARARTHATSAFPVCSDSFLLLDIDSVRLARVLGGLRWTRITGVALLEIEAMPRA